MILGGDGKSWKICRGQNVGTVQLPFKDLSVLLVDILYYCYCYSHLSYNCRYLLAGASSSSSVSDAAANSWLLGDAAKRHLVVKDLMNGANLLSVNSLDVCDNSLLYATDAEQICVIRNLAVV